MKAYLDSFAGLVPCRIVAVGDWSDGGSLARVQFTATRGAYRRGEYETCELHNLVPRNAIYVSNGHYRVRSHRWAELAR